MASSPSGSGGADLGLVAPDAVAAVPPQEAEKSVSVAPESSRRIDQLVDAFIASLAAQDIHSDAYSRQVSQVNSIGDREIRATSEMSNRLLDRPTRALSGLTDGDRSVGQSLVELRHTVEQLNPARYDLSGGPRKLLGVIPFGDKLRNYFDRYTKAQKHIEGIVGSLNDGRSELEKDNASISQEQRSLWTEMETLRQYAYMAERLDTAVEKHIQDVAGSDPERAGVLRQDVLFPVRQRRQEILTQLAVAAQGYAALRVVERNNHELIRAVRTASTTTVSALRTAVMVAQALSDQRAVSDQVKAVNETTSQMIESTSEVLRDQSGDVQELATGTGIDMESLQRAWDNVFAALDQIDAYKLNALEAMKVTVRELTTQVQRSQTYLDRAAPEDANRHKTVEGPSLRLR